MLSVTIPANGKYYIEGVCGLFSAGITYLGLYLYKNSDAAEFAKTYTPFANDRVNGTLGAVATLQAGDTITFKAGVASGQASNMNREYSLVAIRIG
mgnify:CR=1 FL=1